MVELAVTVTSPYWHEVPEATAADWFLRERVAGLAGNAAMAAREAVEYALAVRTEAGGGLTLLLQEPRSSLYAVAVLSALERTEMPATEQSAVALVCGSEVGPWEPTVVPVQMGPHHGFRVSELIAPESATPTGELHAIEVTQTTYVLSVDGEVLTAALSPAPASVAGLVLAMIEPVLASWQVGPRA